MRSRFQSGGSGSGESRVALATWLKGGAVILCCLMVVHQVNVIGSMQLPVDGGASSVDGSGATYTLLSSTQSQDSGKGLGSPGRAKSKVAVVMADNRDFRTADREYLPWAVLLNLRYAAQHEYDLLYYHVTGLDYNSEDTKNSNACMHPTEGWRGSPWCKLPALLHALTTGGYEYVMYLDSDAYMGDVTLSLPALLDRYAPDRPSAPSSKAPSIFFPMDLPYSRLPNSGFMVLRGGGDSEAVALLRRWWNANTTYHNHCHTFEQHALHSKVMQEPRWATALYVMEALRPMNETDGPVMHAETVHRTKERTQRLVLKLAEQDLEAALATQPLPDFFGTGAEQARQMRGGEVGPEIDALKGRREGQVPRWAEDYPRRVWAALRYIEFNATEFAVPYSVLAY